MSEDARQNPSRTRFARGDNEADKNEHRHGEMVHSHPHRGPHDHGDDFEYDEAHDPEKQ